MKSLLIWGIRTRKSQLVWWSVGIVLFIALNLAFYPTFKNQTAQLEQSLQQIPEAARGFFSDTGEFITPTGYLSSQVFYLMLPLLLSIFGISLVSSLLAREEKDKTIELLLSRPIHRGVFLLGKAATGAIALSVVWLIGTLGILIICKIVGLPVPLPHILLASTQTLCFVISVSAVALMLSAGKWTKTSGSVIASIYALLGFVLTSLLATAEWLHWPARLFAFYYYRPGEALRGVVSWSSIVVPLAITFVCLVVAWFAFRKRDLA